MEFCVKGWEENAIEWMCSYLKDRSQKVVMSGQFSSETIVNRGCPQGSRLSPILFLVLMSDLNLHTKKSKLTHFANDTQIHICEDNEENLRRITKEEADSVISFFEGVKFSKQPGQSSTNL